MQPLGAGFVCYTTAVDALSETVCRQEVNVSQEDCGNAPLSLRRLRKLPLKFTNFASRMIRGPIRPTKSADLKRCSRFRKNALFTSYARRKGDEKNRKQNTTYGIGRFPSYR